MKMTFVISSLGAGGAERVLTILANYWSDTGNDINIIILSKKKPFYELNSNIKLISLGIINNSNSYIKALYNNINRIIVLRNEIKKINTEITISLGEKTNILTIISSIGLGKRVIVCEHNHPKYHKVGAVWSTLRSILYPLANEITVLTERAKNYFPRQLRKKIYIIPNPILPANSPQTQTSQQIEKPYIVSIGRLNHQKGFDNLLYAFSRINHIFPNWRVAVFGEGELREDLESLRDKLGLQEQFFFCGLTKNPSTVLSEADLFVLPSRYEGFPMALCEAMAHGLPVIAADCPCGPGEIIRNEHNGILVPAGDIQSLTVALERLMNDLELRRSIARKAPEVVDRFSLNVIIKMWDELLQCTSNTAH